VHVVGIELGREGLRTIAGDRQAVDHVLHLILRAAGVQNAVGFQQPDRFGVHHVGQRSPWQCGDPLLRGSGLLCQLPHLAFFNELQLSRDPFLRTSVTNAQPFFMLLLDSGAAPWRP